MSPAGSAGLAVPRAMERLGDDQASRLREIASRTPDQASSETMMIAVASGKGGVGKTVTSANLCLAFSSLGVRTVLVDADVGTANADVVLGVQPGRRLDDLIADRVVDGRQLDRIGMKIAPGFRLIPGSVGIAGDGSLGRSQRELIGRWLASVERSTDVVVVDTGAGINASVTDFVASADLGVIVVTPDPTSIADAYALYKSVVTGPAPATGRRIGFLINQVTDENEARRVHARLAGVASKFLRMKPGMVGWIPSDPAMVVAVRSQEPVVLGSPGSASASAIQGIAERIAERLPSVRDGARQVETRRSGGGIGWLGRLFGLSG